MTLQVPNPSNLLGAQSPHWLAVALNTGGLSFGTNATDVSFMTTIVAEMNEGILAYTFRISEVFAADEELQLQMSYIGLDGSPAFRAALTLDDTNTPAAGGVFSLLQVIEPIPPGSVVSMTRIYTDGVSPNDPGLAILAQFY